LTDQEASILREAKIVMNQYLYDRVIEMAYESFTPHQKKVLALTQMPDKTYNDIAEILSINYTGVSHAIKGIKSQRHGKYHGGFEKKLRKTCLKDDLCQEYISCIYELRNNDPHYALVILKDYDEDSDWSNFEFDKNY